MCCDHHEKVIYMDNGLITYEGDVNGLLETAVSPALKVACSNSYAAGKSSPSKHAPGCASSGYIQRAAGLFPGRQFSLQRAVSPVVCMEST
jgi:hypothetical protein